MGKKSPQMTLQTIKVLGVFSSWPEDGLSGAEIARVTDLRSGTLYPILLRLEQAGWLKSKWEEGDPKELGRPRRRLYWVTGLGVKKVKATCGEVTAAIGGLSWIG